MQGKLIIEVAVGVFLGTLAAQGVNRIQDRLLGAYHTPTAPQQPAPVAAPERSDTPAISTPQPAQPPPATFTDAPQPTPSTLENCYGRDPSRCSITKPSPKTPPAH
jgi:hypothetical protein